MRQSLTFKQLTSPALQTTRHEYSRVNIKHFSLTNYTKGQASTVTGINTKAHKHVQKTKSWSSFDSIPRSLRWPSALALHSAHAQAHSRESIRRSPNPPHSPQPPIRHSGPSPLNVPILFPTETKPSTRTGISIWRKTRRRKLRWDLNLRQKSVDVHPPRYDSHPHSHRRSRIPIAMTVARNVPLLPGPPGSGSDGPEARERGGRALCVRERVCVSVSHSVGMAAAGCRCGRWSLGLCLCRYLCSRVRVRHEGTVGGER